MANFIPVPTFDLVIFGATGDLSKRKLLPALFSRFLDGQIDARSRVIGSARSELTVDAFRALAEDACRVALAERFSSAEWDRFAPLLDYQALNAAAPGRGWEELAERLTGDGRARIFYLATAPSLYVPVCEAIASACLCGADARVVLEKPIGTDLASAQKINEGVGAVFDESHVFRIDHYLGKETVQNLLVLRFANALFEPIWSRAAVDHVQITAAETLGLEDRAEYYDTSGALRDMVQNHLLQLLCLTAMEPPNSLDADDVRTEKIKVLKALRPISSANVRQCSVRAQYVAGHVRGKAARGYLEELGGRRSGTETFVAVKAELDNWRWAGVPFYLRTGKRMGERRSDIVVTFKPAPHALFGPNGYSHNRLVIRLQPDEGVRLFIQNKEPGPGGLRIRSLPLNLSYVESFMLSYPDAYERLLMDVVRGNPQLFMRRDEVEAAWRWVDGVRQAWTDAETPMETYPAGSQGPLAAAMLMDRDGRAWWEERA